MLTEAIAQRKGAVNMAWVAAKLGDVEAIKKLHKLGADINQVDDDGNTPLWMAAEYGHTDVITQLHKFGADLNKPNISGITPLLIVAEYGHINVISKLVELGADITKTDNQGGTPLWIAAEYGHVDAITELHKLGADLNKADHAGITPFWIAAEYGHQDAMIKLHELGANINTPRNDGTTALFIAAERGHLVVLNYLLQHMDKHAQAMPYVSSAEQLKADVLQYNPDVKQRMDQFIEYQSSLDGYDETRISILPEQIAYIMGHEKIVNAFSTSSGSSNTVDSNTAESMCRWRTAMQELRTFGTTSDKSSKLQF